MQYIDEALEWATRGFGAAAETVRKRHLIAKAILIGLAAGVVGVLLRTLPDFLLEEAASLRAALPASPGMTALWLLGCCSFGALSVWLVIRFAPEAGGGGVPHLRAVLARRTDFRWKRVLAVKTASLVCAVTGGMGAGSEAPAVHAGGACGQGLANLLRAPRGIGEHRALISAGAAAGLSAAFNAPLAGVIFVLEELQGNFSTPVLVCTVLASATADVISRLWIGHPPVFHLHGVVCPPGIGPLLGASLLGLAAGLIGAVFNSRLVASAALGAGKRPLSRVALGAAAAGFTAFLALHHPGMSGGGAPLVELAMQGAPALSLLLTLFALRFLATLMATASGAATGFMVPLLALGALLGRALGDQWNRFFPDSVLPPGIFVAVGMGAFFSASVRAPLTALVLVLELTGDYAFMLPALIACMIAFLVAEELGSPPVYEALSGRPSHSPSDDSDAGSPEGAPARQNIGSSDSISPESSSQSVTSSGARD